MISIETALHAARNYHRANPGEVSRVCEECRADKTILFVDEYGVVLCRACRVPKATVKKRSK